MTMETVIVAMIVAGAVGFIARRMWKTVVKSRAEKAGCGSGCGCGETVERDPLSV
jgi:hypothetical protein